MGLFEDIWDWIKSKVQGLINSSLTSFKTWVRNTINAIVAGIQKVYYTFVDYITNVYNYLSTYVTNVFNTLNQFITNVQNTYNQFITNVNNTYNSFITNVTKIYETYVTKYITNITQNITNVIGASREWVMGYIVTIIPIDFINDPWGYLSAAFTTFLDVWILGTVQSFAEGLQIGLAGNPPEPEGPGASFKLGFDSVVDETEGHVGHG